MHSFTLRTAGKSDIPELVRLRMAYLTEDFGELIPEEKAKIEAQLPEYFRTHLNIDCFVFIAVTEDGETVGCTILCAMEQPANPFAPNGRSGKVMGVYVMPEYRGNRIATWLMKLLLIESRRMQLDRVSLGATRQGYGVYKRLGFRRTRQRYVDMAYDFLPEPEDTLTE